MSLHRHTIPDISVQLNGHRVAPVTSHPNFSLSLHSRGPDTSDPRRRQTLAEKNFEDVAAEWLFVAVWTAIAYYGITLTGLAWYWPVAVGFVVGFGIYKLLSGPLRVVLTGLRYSLPIATLGAIAMFLLQTGV